MNNMQLFTVKQFAERWPYLTYGGLRYKIFNQYDNGLFASGAIIKDGKKVLIDEDKFFAWLKLRSKND
jgi:hypothetical protein